MAKKNPNCLLDIFANTKCITEFMGQKPFLKDFDGLFLNSANLSHNIPALFFLH